MGFASRFASVPLTVIMVVAILTAHMKKIGSVGDFFYVPEVLLLVILIWLVFSGPGKLSIITGSPVDWE